MKKRNAHAVAARQRKAGAHDPRNARREASAFEAQREIADATVGACPVCGDYFGPDAGYISVIGWVCSRECFTNYWDGGARCRSSSPV